jgi:hypothetical protein
MRVIPDFPKWIAKNEYNISTSNHAPEILTEFMYSCTITAGNCTDNPCKHVIAK